MILADGDDGLPYFIDSYPNVRITLKIAAHKFTSQKIALRFFFCNPVGIPVYHEDEK